MFGAPLISYVMAKRANSVDWEIYLIEERKMLFQERIPMRQWPRIKVPVNWRCEMKVGNERGEMFEVQEWCAREEWMEENPEGSSVECRFCWRSSWNTRPAVWHGIAKSWREEVVIVLKSSRSWRQRGADRHPRGSSTGQVLHFMSAFNWKWEKQNGLSNKPWTFWPCPSYPFLHHMLLTGQIFCLPLVYLLN